MTGSANSIHDMLSKQYSHVCL